MKKFITFILSCCIIATSFAQAPEMVIAKAKYTFSHIIDTNQKDKPYVEEMLLILAKDASLYTSNVKQTWISNLQKNMQEQIKKNGGTLENAHITAPKRQRAIQTDLYIFNKEDKLITIENLITNYMVEETLPKIQWKINKDTLSFSGIKCQQATAYFKGRNWTAWFAPNLPFSTGPWKLNGLPGLIIEAHDERKEVQFLFNGFEHIDIKSTEKKYKNEDEKFLNTDYAINEIKLPTKVVKVSLQDLTRLKEASKNDPYGFAKTQLSGTGMAGLMDMTRKTPPAPPANNQALILNNPIELK